MSVKVAINGFGRIGRLALRLMINDPEFDVVAVNDLTDPAMLAHLFKYDSAQGRFDGEISVKEGALFTMGLDYYALGKRTGEMAIEILKGKPVSQIPFETSKQMKLYVNSKTAQALGLDLKNPAFNGAEFVGK